MCKRARSYKLLESCIRLRVKEATRGAGEGPAWWILAAKGASTEVQFSMQRSQICCSWRARNILPSGNLGKLFLPWLAHYCRLFWGKLLLQLSDQWLCSIMYLMSNLSQAAFNVCRLSCQFCFPLWGCLSPIDFKELR